MADHAIPCQQLEYYVTHSDSVLEPGTVKSLLYLRALKVEPAMPMASKMC